MSPLWVCVRDAALWFTPRVTLMPHAVLDELDPTFPRTFYLTVTRFTTPYAFIRELLSYHKERTGTSRLAALLCAPTARPLTPSGMPMPHANAIAAAKDNASLFQVVTIVKHWLQNYFHHIALRDRMQVRPLRPHVPSCTSVATSSRSPRRAVLNLGDATPVAATVAAAPRHCRVNCSQHHPASGR